MASAHAALTPPHSLEPGFFHRPASTSPPRASSWLLLSLGCLGVSSNLAAIGVGKEAAGGSGWHLGQVSAAFSLLVRG